jgi:Large exoproteins involved in heme utilization or adhesion
VRNGAVIAAGTSGPGRGGNLTINAHDLEVRNGADISAGTFSAGRGGNLTVEAGRVFLSGDGSTDFTGISANANEGTGDAGDLMVKADSLEVRNGAQVSASTFSTGNSGKLLVEADSVFLSGDGAANATGLFAQANRGNSGDAGDLTVKAGSLEVHNGAVISASTFGPGRGGNLAIDAHDLEVSNGGQIGAVTSGPGRGGNVTVNATSIELRDGSTIAAESKSAAPDAGESGSISITARDTFRLFNGSSVSVETAQANAGSIDLHVSNLLHLRDGSSITTSVSNGLGDGGNIRIDPRFTVLDRGSEIVAQAREGRGGNIQIVSDFFFASPDSRVSASSEKGIQGTVEIDSPDIDITGGITVLPASFLEAAALLSERCAVRSARSQSSLIVGGRGGLPIEPGTSYLPAFYMDMPESTHVQRSIRIEDGATGDFYSPELVDTPFESFGLGCENW